MKITDEAKELLEKFLKEAECEALILTTNDEGYSKSIDINLVKLSEMDSDPIDINGIKVFTDEETLSWSDEVEIIRENGDLALFDPNASYECGCGSHDHSGCGCGSHDHSSCGCDSETESCCCGTEHQDAEEHTNCGCGSEHGEGSKKHHGNCGCK